MGQKPHLQLKDLGSKLQIIPSSIEVLIQILKQAATCLTDMDQSPSASALESMKPFLNAIVKSELLKHQDRDVKLLVATCVCEITRITAPEAPYSDDVLKDIFQLIVSTFSGLSDISSPSFGMEVAMLDTLAKYRSCVVMLDLECDDLVNEIFNTFFAVVRDDHPESVLSSMQSIMAVLLEESEDVREDLLSILLSTLGREKRDVTAAARKLSMNVIQQCIGTLEPSIKEFFLSLVSGKSKPVNSQLQNHEVLYDICCCAPQILSGILPYVTGELETDQLETRLKAVNLVGDIIALPGISSALAFQPILSEFLKTLTDTDFGVRMSVLDHVKSSLLSNPQRPEAPQLISALCDGLMDSDENFRKQIVAVICDVACHALHAVPFDAVNLVAERLHDKSQLVKKYTLERLIEIYRVFCEKSSDNVNPDGYDWIPGKILRCFHDNDFRSDTIESVLCGSLFPSEFAMNDMVKHWVDIFSGLDNVEVKALEKILEQKQRLQEELQKYLALRQNSQDKENPEVQKKIMFCFRVMSRSFAAPTEAEESFQILDQLNDTNIWKILTNLVDPNTSFHQTRAYRDDLIKILGEKHQLNEFLNTLYVKCSYLLFNKEHTTAILSEIIRYNSAENDQRIQSCMNILVIIARFSPHLFSGSEEDLVKLLKDSNNDMIKEGTLNVLAKAGGTIREQLAVTSSSVDLMLERLCLEGSRRQAKYAVHALAAITKDDGLKSLSVLYKRLVDTMEEKTNLPTVLQSLGCIAQTAMPVFETRESEIEEFIINKILKSDGKDEITGASWDDKSDICVLKIYGIKTIVKSYLPVKDALVRPGIDGLLDILRNMLSYGEISKDIKSSSVDKAHLRLASAKAVLRLARLWDHKIPADIFHLTLRTSDTGFPQAKKVFLSKVHQYLKDHNLEAKYACAFILNIFGTNSEEFAEDKQNLTDVIHMYHQERAGQLSGQSDAKPLTTYPEYILPYLVHALANLSCPNIDECKDAEAYKTIYRQLHLILSMLVQRDEDVKSEVTADKEKETISAITSIFQSIKLSEDAVDASKSKNSHAICDLGLAITKRLLQKDVDMQGLSSVSLPPILYKACEKENDLKASEVTTWLADESVLALFESVELESVPSQSAEDHALKDSEKDRNEVPLGKIVKKIRSRGTKGKKVVKKNKTMTVETKKAGDDFDIINMVREINLDNLGISTNFESSNGHESSLSKKVQKDPEFGTIKKRKVGEETLAPVPKRKRSAVTHGKSRPSSSSKASQRISEEVPSGGKLLLNAGVSPDTGSKNMQRKLVKGKEPSSEQKIKASENHRIDESDKSEDHDIKGSGKLKTPNKTKNENFKTSAGSTKRQKRKSIGGLAKCTTKEGESDAEDLIGCRVKVWWPLDKKFYKGTIQSYDSSKRKHAILYDDGEVEKLCLEKKMKKKTPKQHTITEIKTLGQELLSSASHINNLPLLLTFISPSSPPHHILESILSLHSFFLPLLPQLPSSAATSSSSSADSDQSEFIYLTWLRSKFDEFLKLLIDVLVADESDETIKEVVLDTLMEFVKVANGGAFHSSLYNRILRSIIHSTSNAEFLIDLLISKYFKYIDVRYFTFISLEKLARNLDGKDASDDKTASADGTDESQLSSSTEFIIHNMYYTISHIPPLEKSDDTSHLEMWSLTDDKQLKSKKRNNNVLSAARIAKKMKLKFTKAWIAYLRLPLPLDLFKEVLVNLHQAVIPHLSNPIMLCDFLTRSYDVGGVVSVMALNSLFILMTQHGLEYPKFYEKLYALLVPSIFMAKHRARFFQLLDSCLKSPLLPAYLAASFAKKLSRLLLSVPPSGALVITALVHNILRRHPSINCLVHREEVNEDSEHRTDEETASNLDNAHNGAKPCQKSGLDHFNIEESDPMKSGAMRSSLWEIDTALHHYCPPVSRFALSLGTDLTVRAKTSEVNIGDFSAGSYATILGAEITRRVKQVPLAFYKTTPSSLFSENDFAGWTFKCEENSETIIDNNENGAKDLLDQEHSPAKRQRIECQ